eukprot:g35183.t1
MALNSSDRASQEVVEEQRLSPESEAQSAAPALDHHPLILFNAYYTNNPNISKYFNDTYVEESLELQIRTALNEPLQLIVSLTRSPHCIVAPTMPTLPEEEEGSEDQESSSSSKRLEGSITSVGWQGVFDDVGNLSAAMRGVNEVNGWDVGFRD